MSEALEAVGVREAKNRFSELTALVNQTGAELVVLKNSRPWVVIQPADAAAKDRHARLDGLCALTAASRRMLPTSRSGTWPFLIAICSTMRG